MPVRLPGMAHECTTVHGGGFRVQPLAGRTYQGPGNCQIRSWLPANTVHLDWPAAGPCTQTGHAGVCCLTWTRVTGAQPRAWSSRGSSRSPTARPGQLLEQLPWQLPARQGRPQGFPQPQTPHTMPHDEHRACAAAGAAARVHGKAWWPLGMWSSTLNCSSLAPRGLADGCSLSHPQHDCKVDWRAGDVRGCRSKASDMHLCAGCTPQCSCACCCGRLIMRYQPSMRCYNDCCFCTHVSPSVMSSMRHVTAQPCIDCVV